MNTAKIYAPKSAAKIAEAAQLIRKVSTLLDTHSTPVIALIEAIPGTERIDWNMADALEALAARLET